MNFRKLVLITTSFVMVAAMGFCGGFWFGTGSPIISIFTPSQGLGPPEDIMVKTTEEARQVVEEAVKDSVYDVGQNCVDFTQDAIRALQWDGQLGVPVIVIFEDGTSHKITCTATTSGWVFLESQSGTEVHPVPGGYYMGKKIEFVMVDVEHYFHFHSWVLNPVFVIIEELE